jgi:thymidine phosphorylase
VPAAAGVICQAKPGEHVITGQTIVELRGDDPARLDAALAELAGAIEIGDDPPPATPLVIERIGF